MIEEYLKPLEENKDEKKKVKEGLKDLKNSIALSFMLLNSMWVAAIFMLQDHQDQLNVKWPIGEKLHNITFESRSTPGQDANIIYMSTEYLQLEPIGTFFMVTFILIMAIQFVGMVLHRLMTLGHIVASTKLFWFKRKGALSSEEYLNRHGVEVIKEIQDNIDISEGGATMEEAVEQTLKDITEGGEDTPRRFSRTATIKKLHRGDTISALKKKQSQYGQRKETVRRRTIRAKAALAEQPINEETLAEDTTDSVAIQRTISKVDPEGLEHRHV